jgi:hypothetical protein
MNPTGTVGIENAAGTAGVAVLPGNSVSAIPSTSYQLTPAPSPLPASFGTHAAAYNQGDLGLYHYDTGAAIAGALVSEPFFVLPGTRNVEFRFDYARQTADLIDVTRIDVQPLWPSVAGGSPAWAAAYTIPAFTSVPCGVPTTVCIRASAPACPANSQATPNPSLSSLIGKGGRVRFVFDTVTGANNGASGWYVDNVSVEVDEPWIFLPFGTGCAGSGPGIPQILSTGGPPIAGAAAPFALTVQGAPASSLGFLWIGFTNASGLGVDLPLNLGILGAPDCFLYVDPFVPFGLPTNAAGQATKSLSIPAVASGVTFFAQAFFLPTPGVGSSLATTQAVFVRIL